MSRFSDVLPRFLLTFYRIEDNVVITETGSENLTTAPKDPDEMERIISSS